MKTLAIETSCDDTSVAIVTFDGNLFEVEVIFAYSQVKDHLKYGGVVPEIASRFHSEKVVQVLENIGWEKIKGVDFISVTTHPGLPGSLVVGRSVAYQLGSIFDKEVVEVNHIDGHIFSLFLERPLDTVIFPIMVLTASGGHNNIYLVDKIASGNVLGNFVIKEIGRSIDDAAGESFDKVARMLGGPYPGGPRIGASAAKYRDNKSSYDNKFSNNQDPNINKLGTGKFFKRIRLDDTQEFNFSFSGMKSQAGRIIDILTKAGIEIDENDKNIIAYEFEEAVAEILTQKLINAATKYSSKTIAISGGVSANTRLRGYFNEIGKANNFENIIKPLKMVYCTDNAAMIGVAGVIKKITK